MEGIVLWNLPWHFAFFNKLKTALVTMNEKMLLQVLFEFEQ